MFEEDSLIHWVRTVDKKRKLMTTDAECIKTLRTPEVLIDF